MLGDGGAVLRAGEAVAAEILADDIVGRPPPLVDRLEQLDRRFDAGAGRHRCATLRVVASGRQRLLLQPSATRSVVRREPSPVRLSRLLRNRCRRRGRTRDARSPL
jgi:hypothetical protein